MLTTPWLLTIEAETLARIEQNKGVVPIAWADGEHGSESTCFFVTRFNCACSIAVLGSSELKPSDGSSFKIKKAPKTGA